MTQGHFFQAHGPRRPPSSSHSNDVVLSGAPLHPTSNRQQPTSLKRQTRHRTSELSGLSFSSNTIRKLRPIVLSTENKPLSQTDAPLPSTRAPYSPRHPPTNVKMTLYFTLVGLPPPSRLSRAPLQATKLADMALSGSSQLVGSGSVRQHANTSHLGVYAAGGGDGIVHAPHHPHSLHPQAEDVHVCPQSPRPLLPWPRRLTTTAA